MHLAQATTPANMQTNMPANMMEQFDGNNDGLISFEDLPADQPPVYSEKISKYLHQDDDGMISAEEFASAREYGHKGKRKNKP